MLQGFLVFRVRFTREGSAMRFGISSLSIVLLSFAGVVAGTGCSSADLQGVDVALEPLRVR